MLLNNLPLEILFEIFSYLELEDILTLAETNEQLKNRFLTFNSELNFENQFSVNTQEALNLFANPQNIKKVNLNGCFWINTDTLLNKLSKCKNLTHLNLLNIEVKNSTLLKLLETLDCLKSLAWQFHHDLFEKVSKKVEKVLGNLKHYTVYSTQGTFEKAQVKPCLMLRYCDSLESLEVELFKQDTYLNMHSYHDISFCNFYEEMRSFFKRIPYTKPSVFDKILHSSGFKLQANSLLSQIDSQKSFQNRLTKLTIHIYEKDIKKVLSGCPNLIDLTVLFDGRPVPLPDCNLPELTSLTLYSPWKFKYWGLYLLNPKMPKLEKLTLINFILEFKIAMDYQEFNDLTKNLKVLNIPEIHKQYIPMEDICHRRRRFPVNSTPREIFGQLKLPYTSLNKNGSLHYSSHLGFKKPRVSHERRDNYELECLVENNPFITKLVYPVSKRLVNYTRLCVSKLSHLTNLSVNLENDEDTASLLNIAKSCRIKHLSVNCKSPNLTKKFFGEILLEFRKLSHLRFSCMAINFLEILPYVCNFKLIFLAFDFYESNLRLYESFFEKYLKKNQSLSVLLFTSPSLQDKTKCVDRKRPARLIKISNKASNISFD